MDKTVRKVANFAEQKAETYLYWHSRPSAEIFEATYQLSVELYRQKGLLRNGERLQRTIVHIQRA